MTPKQFVVFDGLCDRLAGLRQRWDAVQKKSAQTAVGIVDAAKSANGPDVKRHLQRLHDHMIAEQTSLSAEFMRELADVAKTIEYHTHRAYRRERRAQR
jgi:hypothetical protein